MNTGFKKVCAIAMIAAITLCGAGCGGNSAPADTGVQDAGAGTEVKDSSTEQAGTTEQADAAGQADAAEQTDAAEQAEAPDPNRIIDVLPLENDVVAGSKGSDSTQDTDLPLKDAYADYFKVGVAVQAIDHWGDQTAEIGNKDKEEIICREFNSMTFGNEWKPAYNFSATSDTLYKVDRAAEELLDWAKEHGIPVRGHTLVWHSQCDPAIFAKDFKALSNGKETHDWTARLDEDCLVSREVLLDRLKTYINGFIEYTYEHGYADVVYAFDVVNEASEESRDDGLRNSYYYSIIGPDFLYYIFLYAREAEMTYAEKYAGLYGLDPATDDLSPIMPKLFYNDYNEWFDARVRAIRHFIAEEPYNEGQGRIKSKAIREGGDGTIAGDGLIDGIGMQGHLDDTQNINQYIKALRAYDEIVDEVQITELDVGETTKSNLGEAKQAEFYNKFFRALIEERKNGVNLTSVTFWGLTDDASWRTGANPLLYHGDLSEKPAYKAVQLAAFGIEYEAGPMSMVGDASSVNYDFEPKSVDGVLLNPTAEEMGFYSRGTGHQSKLDFANKINHTEGAIIGRSMIVTREEQDATVRLDISPFIGKTVRVALYVKTEDTEITFGVSGDEDITITTVKPSEEWTLLEGRLRLDENLSSASVYIETNGNADIYIDDVVVETIE